MPNRISLLLALCLNAVLAEDVYKNVFYLNEDIGINLIFTASYKDDTTKTIYRKLGNISYTPGTFFVVDTTVGIDNAEMLSGAGVTVIFHNNTSPQGYKYGEINLVAIKPNTTSKRLLLGKTSGPKKAAQPTKNLPQWIPTANVFFTFDQDQYVKLPRSYYLDGSNYLPDGVSTALLESQSNYITLSGNGVMDLPFKLNISVVPVNEAKKIALKANLFLNSGNFLSSSDLKDAQNMFLNVSPNYLKFLGIISFAHTILTFLTIKNDISFWVNLNDDFSGMSVINVAGYAFFSVMATLSLIDSEASSLLILLYIVDSCVSLWKLSKIFVFRRRIAPSLLRSLCIPHAHLNKTVATSISSKYDRIAFKWLSILVFPAVIAYCGYTLFAVPQKGWISWVVDSLAGFGYAYGFILMTPQLFINYKLKSVAHLPWRSLMYRAVNTFIDDAFSVVITMPFIHKVSCFRDDVVFLIYLYQRYIYPVDESRSSDEDSGTYDDNEEASSGEDDDNDEDILIE